MVNTTKSSLVELRERGSILVVFATGRMRNSRSVIGQGRLRSYLEPVEEVSMVTSAADTEKYPASEGVTNLREPWVGGKDPGASTSREALPSP